MAAFTVARFSLSKAITPKRVPKREFVTEMSLATQVYPQVPLTSMSHDWNPATRETHTEIWLLGEMMNPSNLGGFLYHPAIKRG